MTDTRHPPQSTEAEQAVIGGLLIRNDAFPLLSDWLTASDFYRRDHQMIFAAMAELFSAEQPADAVTLAEWMDERGQEAGGLSYLIELASTTPSAANIVAYAEIVREKSILRKMIEAGTVAANNGFNPEGRTSRELAAISTAAFLDLSGGSRPRGPQTLAEVGKAWFAEISERHENGGGMIGLPTPWAKFNAITGGLQPGQLIIIAARPSMGKSAWAINAILPNVMRGKRVMFFNLEMSASSIYSRAVGCLQGVPLGWFRDPQGHDDHWAKVSAGVSTLRDKPLIIDDTPGMTGAQIVSRVKREHMRSPVDMVVIDHLHLMQIPGKTRADIEIGHITAALKGLAKGLGIPVVLLSQLNRGLESRSNKRPIMSDLRESGNIEQDADLIAFLYRDDYYAEQEGRESEAPGLVEVNIAKQRDGETGKVWGRFIGKFGRIEDLDDCDIPEKRTAKVTNFAGVRGGKDRAANS